MRTVGKVLEEVLPNGTRPESQWKALFAAENRDPSLDPLAKMRFPPLLPTDLFAAVGHLARISGIVPFFEPSAFATNLPPRRFIFDKNTRAELDDAGVAWRDDNRGGRPPPLVDDLWSNLLDHWDEPLNPPPVVGTDSVPEWWISTLKLVTLADMAVNRLLRDPVSTEGHNAQIWETVIRDIYRRRAAMGKRPPASLTLMADTSVVCVMPKVRVAAVGATLRNMTRNLALLPGHREVRCRWDFSPDVAPSEDLDTLDILLIPAPFELQGNNFVANRDANATLSELRYYKKGWETFRIEQTWIKGEKRASFIEDCLKLMERARQETACVNGVILPEYALDYDLFHELCTALKGIEKNLEFVISGSSSNCRTDDGEYRANENDEVPNLGNHVVSRVWYDRGREEVYIDNSRIKHHRWRLDRPQVETYALSTALNPKIENWWEDTPLGRREIAPRRHLAVDLCLVAGARTGAEASGVDGPAKRKRKPQAFVGLAGGHGRTCRGTGAAQPHHASDRRFHGHGSVLDLPPARCRHAGTVRHAGSCARGRARDADAHRRGPGGPRGAQLPPREHRQRAR
jgi:hypothetical protein